MAANGWPLAGAPVRVLLIDGEESFRAATRALLAADGRFDVVGEADSSLACLTAARELEPQIVLLDLRLAGEDGAALIGPLMRAIPASMIAVLSALPPSRHRERLRSLGAFAYYDKTQLADLPDLLAVDHAAFARALDGEDIVAPAACAY